MTVIWLNGTVGSGKSAVGRALAGMLPCAVFRDGDDLAGPPHLPNPVRWDAALHALLRVAGRPCRSKVLVVAYPLDRPGYSRLRTVCGRARRRLLIVNLATPLTITLRGRGGRVLDTAERTRVRDMRSKGNHRRPFATVTLTNAAGPAASTARTIARRSQAHFAG